LIIEKPDFISLFEKNGIAVSGTQYDKFSTYSKMLVEYNSRCNLTAILDPEGITIKHFFDSIIPFYKLDVKKGASLIDVGTGAGFPSVPLKIMRDDLKLTLLDSLNKRIVFLTELSEKLEIEAECIHARAEEAGHNFLMREKFDIVTARAVAALPVLCEYCIPFVKVGGIFVSLKGSNGMEELDNARNAIKALGCVVEKTESYQLPNGDLRTMNVIRKISHTNIKYPRNKGQMTKKPL